MASSTMRTGSPDTRTLALAKLRAVTNRVGYSGALERLFHS